MPLDRFSERYAATGNLASEGVRNQLGRPDKDPIAILIREAVQNCWDAHLPDDPHIQVTLELRTIDPRLRSVLKTEVFADPAPETQMSDAFGDEDRQMHLLLISDRNTSGLGGPTRADILTTGSDEPTDFVDFLRNIGQPPDKALGGGTFGYGKAALYQMSRLRTILVDTRCTYKGQVQRRFISACLGDGFKITSGPNEGRYTGRHWWGRMSSGGDIADPLEGEEAIALSEALGFPGYDGDERGSTLAILDFGTGLERPPEKALSLIIESILWNFWPKMIPDSSGKPSITFRVLHNGEEQSVPDPRSWPPLDGFCSALEALEEHRREGSHSNPFAHVVPIHCLRPKKLLGHAAFVRMQHQRWQRSADAQARLGKPDGKRSHHVAWMRDAKLVVKYEPGPYPTGDLLDWAGVYVTSKEVDRAYAQSEPPTHDDWVPSNLDNRHDKTFVKVGLRRLKDECVAFVEPAGSDPSGEGSQVPLGSLARGLGALLTGHFTVTETKPKSSKGGSGGGSTDSDTTGVTDDDEIQPDDGDDEGGGEGGDGGNGGGDGTIDGESRRPPGKPRVRIQSPELKLHDGQGCLSVPFQLTHGKRSQSSLVTAYPYVEVDGHTSEKDPPAGGDTPTVLFWESPERQHTGHGSSQLEITQAGLWRVWVRLIDEAPVRVRVTGVAKEST